MLFLIVVSAARTRAETPEDWVRRIVGSVQSKNRDRHWEPVLVSVPAPNLPDLRCEWVESTYGVTDRHYLRLCPGGPSVDVTWVHLRLLEEEYESLGDVTSFCEVKQATIDSTHYAAICRTTALVAALRARPIREPDAGPLASSKPAPSPRALHWWIGEIASSDDAGSDSAADSRADGAPVEPRVKALLFGALLQDVTSRLQFGPHARPDVVVRELARDLPDLEGWRRELRVSVLGWLGGIDELALLRSLQPRDRLTERAILQLETARGASRSEHGVAALVALLDDEQVPVREWARALLRTRFAAPYKKTLLTRFNAEPEGRQRLSILREYAKLESPCDHALCGRALRDPSARVRVEAASHLEHIDTLVAVAQDKSLRSESDIAARLAAILYLSYDYPLPFPEEVVAPVLRRILRDHDEDARVRHEATVAVGWIGDRTAIAELIDIVRRPIASEYCVLEEDFELDEEMYRVRYDIRAAAAEALGMLRARESLRILVETVEAETRVGNTSPGTLGFASAEALARIGDGAALPSLEKTLHLVAIEERSAWLRLIRLVTAIRSGDGRQIIEASPGGNRRFQIGVLASAVDGEALKALASVAPYQENEWKKVIEAAIAEQQRRERSRR